MTNVFEVTHYSEEMNLVEKGRRWAQVRRERTERVEADTAVEAIMKVCLPVSCFASFTALEAQHGHGEPQLDNAHAQYNRAGTHGIYARRAA